MKEENETKKCFITALSVLLLFSLAACGLIGKLPQPFATTQAAAESLAGAYVEILKSDSYQFGYPVAYEGVETTVTGAPKDGGCVYRVTADEGGTLIGLALSHVEDDASYFTVTEFPGVVDEALFALPDYNAMFEEAMAFYDNEEYYKSFPLFEKLSNTKYAKAMAYLGDSYYYGRGVEENEEAALIWYKAVTDAGDPYGQACLGDCYYFGYCGVEEDDVEAVK